MDNSSSKEGKAKLLSKMNGRYVKKLQESECGTRQLAWILPKNKLMSWGKKWWRDCSGLKETSKT